MYIGNRRDTLPSSSEYREMSTKELLRELVGQTQVLVREEARVMRGELVEEGKRAARAGSAYGMASVAGHTALLCFAALLILIGATFLAAWVSALVVFVLFSAVAAIAYVYGKQRFEQVQASRPVQHLKEDGRWAKETMQDLRSKRHVHA